MAQGLAKPKRNTACGQAPYNFEQHCYFFEYTPLFLTKGNVKKNRSMSGEVIVLLPVPLNPPLGLAPLVPDNQNRILTVDKCWYIHPRHNILFGSSRSFGLPGRYSCRFVQRKKWIRDVCDREVWFFFLQIFGFISYMVLPRPPPSFFHYLHRKVSSYCARKVNYAMCVFFQKHK